ncbi:MAG: hypothetical protein AAB910_03495 [Patescibacteria group bacterium]
MSRFEDRSATRKRVRRRHRQQFLKDCIGGYKMASFTFAEAFRLFQLFALAAPSDDELAEAGSLIEAHVEDIAKFWREFNAME